MSEQAIRAVTVYCSSSKSVAGHYFEAAEKLGRGIAESGWTLVYGGNCIGMMGKMANAARSAGGKVVGITPQLLVDKGIGDSQCDELVVTTGMRDRKALLEQRGDAFIAMPGGIGTLEEVFEILVGRHLGYHSKPIVLLNLANFYGPLLEMLRHGLEQKFIRAGVDQLFYVANSVEEAVTYLRRHSTVAPPAVRGQTLSSAIE